MSGGRAWDGGPGEGSVSDKTKVKFPNARYLVLTWDPAAPAVKVPVGKAGTVEKAKDALKALLKRADGWALGIFDSWDGYAPVPVEG